MGAVVRKKVAPTKGVTISPAVTHRRIGIVAAKLKDLTATVKAMTEGEGGVTELRSKLQDMCREIGLKSEVFTTDEGMVITVTMVQPETAVLNEQDFIKELNDYQLAAVSRSIIDHKLIEDALAKGIIDGKLVEKHTKIVPKTSYVKVT